MSTHKGRPKKNTRKKVWFYYGAVDCKIKKKRKQCLFEEEIKLEKGTIGTTFKAGVNI